MFVLGYSSIDLYQSDMSRRQVQGLLIDSAPEKMVFSASLSHLTKAACGLVLCGEGQHTPGWAYGALFFLDRNTTPQDPDPLTFTPDA
jgi:hypothetical protein